MRARDALSLEASPIGRDLRWPWPIAAVAVAIVALDLRLLPWQIDFDWPSPRIVPALVAIAAMALLARGRLDAIGLRLRPLPSLRFWAYGTLGIAAVFAAIGIVAFAIYVAIYGLVLPSNMMAPTFRYWAHAYVEAPVIEETIYRWLLVTALAAVLSKWQAVVVSGIAFAYLHVLYHAAAPNNLAAGFVFAWMYLRSGSIAMPIAYHALGNFAVTLIGMAAYQLLG